MNNCRQKKWIFTFIIFLGLLKPSISIAIEVPITIFPLENYDQNISHWIKPSDPDYDKPLIKFSTQKKRVQEFYNRYYSSGPNAKSPWSRNYVIKTLAAELPEDVSKEKILIAFGNSAKPPIHKIGFGANFRPHTEKWINEILVNMDLEQFALPIKFRRSNRGIVVKNSSTRSLPTNDPSFYNFALVGEGYPFDNLQRSAVWVGTPVYIVGKTQDYQWYLVLTPHFMAWIPSDNVAKVSRTFVAKWQRHARQKMVAITKTNLSIFDLKNQFRFSAYIGSIFPGIKSRNKKTITILIPYADTKNNARITFAKLSYKNAAVIPLKATPHNFAEIISRLLGRPYGWGNMYFYNDCSAELQSLYTPFGIWLPRNSKIQITAGEVLDKTAATMEERIKYLMANGKKFVTIIYVGGHTMLYLGNYPNPNSAIHELIPMTYQNTWRLKSKDNSYVAVIGKSVLMPLLKLYPENLQLNSFANRDVFKISFFDQPPKQVQK